MRRSLRTAAFLAAIFLWGCAASQKESASAPSPRPYGKGATGSRISPAAKKSMPGRNEEASIAAMDLAVSQPLVAQDAFDAGGAAAAEFDGPTPPAPPAGTPASTNFVQKATARLVAYQGELRLASLEPDALLDSAERRARAMDGYVESRNARHLVLRVPVNRFDDLFQSVRSLGKVLGSRKTAQDVTEEVEGTDLELQLRRTQLAKLKSILQRETKINERANLLQEIRRVSEEIARLEARSALLRKRVQLSTLQVDAFSLVAAMPRSPVPPSSMEWISSLFGEVPPWAERWNTKELPLANSPEFVPLSSGSGGRAWWQAASADGSTVSNFRIANSPVGDARFWRSAIVHFRGEAFDAADTFAVADWAVARLPPIQPGGPIWWVALRVRGKHLDVAQARLSPASDRQLGPALRRMLQESKP